MDKSELDQLRLNYKQAVERWVAAIRAEENLATPDHSSVAVEEWDQASLAEDQARNAAKAAREEYRDALREVLFNF
ncbi:MAG: hypothetical protein JOZ32_06385 [Bryobacterales bacterium]|nr:hypothetical protein [Bryobacterales bacterium]